MNYRGCMINGIWKSGNHLLFKLMELMGIHDAKFGVASSSIFGKYYYLRKIIRSDLMGKGNISVGIDVDANISAKWLRNKIIKNSGKCIGGHAAYSMRLSELLTGTGFKTIQIVRDPRAILASYAHWIKTRPDYYAYSAHKNNTVKESIIQLINGGSYCGLYYEPFSVVLDRSYGWLTDENVLVVRFEDLVGEMGGGDNGKQHEIINTIADNLGIEGISTSSIASRLFGGTATFRSGNVNKWQDDFDDDIIKIYSERIAERHRAWGY